jgi:hypothetical protein
LQPGILLPCPPVLPDRDYRSGLPIDDGHVATAGVIRPISGHGADLVAVRYLVEQLRQPERPRRGPYRRAEDDAVLAEIRAITDERPTYGYRRVTALLNRARR